MKLKNIKKNGKFKQFKNGFTYKKISKGDSDVLDKSGKRLFGAVFDQEMEVRPVS
jgi:hypothetical protein